MTNTELPLREDVFVPQDEAATTVAAAAAAERVRQEYQTRRVIIHWSFISGIILMFLTVLVIGGLSS